MSESAVIVWDLETVPDLQAAVRIEDLDYESEEQARDILGSGFPKHPLHSIACIGALIAKREDQGWRTTAIGAHTLEIDQNPSLSALSYTRFVARAAMAARPTPWHRASEPIGLFKCFAP
jgi:hypothetical protein